MNIYSIFISCFWPYFFPFIFFSQLPAVTSISQNPTDSLRLYKYFFLLEAFPDHINQHNHSPSEIREFTDDHMVLIIVPCVPKWYFFSPLRFSAYRKVKPCLLHPCNLHCLAYCLICSGIKMNDIAWRSSHFGWFKTSSQAISLKTQEHHYRSPRSDYYLSVFNCCPWGSITWLRLTCVSGTMAHVCQGSYITFIETFKVGIMLSSLYRCGKRSSERLNKMQRSHS